MKHRHTPTLLLAALLLFLPCLFVSAQLPDMEEEFEEIPPAQIIAFLKAKHPAGHKYLAESKEFGRGTYRDTLFEYEMLMLNYKDLLEVQPAAAKAMLQADAVEIRIATLMDQLYETKDKKQIVALKREIGGLVVQLFDFRIIEDKGEVAIMERELDNIKKGLIDRSKRREDLIKKRLQFLFYGDDPAENW